MSELDRFKLASRGKSSAANQVCCATAVAIAANVLVRLFFQHTTKVSLWQNELFHGQFAFS